ncbi:MAG: sensor histidine kinase [Burkholderiales bacterium]|nr:sensor histidine kinase [Burkholderiales bacterium]
MPASTLAPDLPPLAPIASPPQRARLDLGIVVIATAAVFAFAAFVELSETLSNWARHYEGIQADELPSALLALLLGLTWYSWRRHRDAQAQMALRVGAQAALERTLAENRAVVKRGLQMQEDERRRIARELHDEMGQWLNALKLDAVALRDRADATPEVRGAATAIIDLANHAYDAARNLIRELRPVALDELGLASALQYLLDQWRRRQPEVCGTLAVSGVADGLDETTNITIYRFVQECLTNVARHAAARDVRITLDCGPDRVRVEVRDDGRGFDPAQRHAGLGMVGLRERVEGLGGEFRADAAPGAGTRVMALVPRAAERGAARAPAEVAP